MNTVEINRVLKATRIISIFSIRTEKLESSIAPGSSLGGAERMSWLVLVPLTNIK